jgi:Spy/CpxP family protein refolding chaperone
MRIRTTIRALAVCVLLVGLTAPGRSYADSRRPPRDAGSQSDRFIEEQAEQLGLDEKTMAAIRTIVDGSRARGETLRAELRTANAQMRALLSQALPDEAAVMQQADTIGALELAERKNRLQAMLQIRTLLTSAQRQELIRRQGELYSRRRPDLMQACQADSTNLCPDATHWRSRMQCLHNHLEELSETCRATIQAR